MARPNPNNNSARWWAQNIIVPIVGGGGLVTLLVAVLPAITRKNTGEILPPPSVTLKYDQFDIILGAGPKGSVADVHGRRVVALPAIGDGHSHPYGSATLVKMIIAPGKKIIEPITIIQTDPEIGSLSDFVVSARLQEGTTDVVWVGGHSQRPKADLRVGVRLVLQTDPL